MIARADTNTDLLLHHRRPLPAPGITEARNPLQKFTSNRYNRHDGDACGKTRQTVSSKSNERLSGMGWGINNCSHVLKSSCSSSNQALYRMVLQLHPRLLDRGVHLLHRISELYAESAEDISLPCVVLGVDPSLDLLIVHDTDTKSSLCF